MVRHVCKSHSLAFFAGFVSAADEGVPEETHSMANSMHKQRETRRRVDVVNFSLSNAVGVPASLQSRASQRAIGNARYAGTLGAPVSIK